MSRWLCQLSYGPLYDAMFLSTTDVFVKHTVTLCRPTTYLFKFQ